MKLVLSVLVYLGLMLFLGIVTVLTWAKKGPAPEDLAEESR